VSVAVALLVATAPVAGARDRAGGAARAGAASQLRAVERARLRALVRGDIPALRRRMAADFQLVTPDGERLSRADLLEALRGSLDFRAIDVISPIRVRLYGAGAVLTYTVRLDVVGSGMRLQHDARDTCVYERRGARWLLVWQQTTAVGGFPPS
jgi:hypothetical protein